MENVRKKNQIKSPFSHTKYSVEGQSCRLEKVEDRILEPKDKLKLKKNQHKP
jgi:hypothetical protein